MSATDWILLAVLLASLLLGAWRGLVYEVMSVLGWVLAFFLAQWWAPDLAPRLPMAETAEPLRYAAAFVLIFVGVAFISGLIAWATKKLVLALGLRPVDRTLGAAFGLVRGVVLLLAITVVIGMTPMRSAAWWKESAGADILTTVLKGLKPVLPQDFAKYLPT